MSNPFTPRVGAVMSADIAVPEHEREVAFYSRALTTGDAEADQLVGRSYREGWKPEGLR